MTEDEVRRRAFAMPITSPPVSSHTQSSAARWDGTRAGRSGHGKAVHGYLA